MKVDAQNPWTGSIVELDVNELDASVIYQYLTDEQKYQLEGVGENDAEWIKAVADLLGPEEFGEITIGS